MLASFVFISSFCPNVSSADRNIYLVSSTLTSRPVYLQVTKKSFCKLFTLYPLNYYYLCRPQVDKAHPVLIPPSLLESFQAHSNKSWEGMAIKHHIKKIWHILFSDHSELETHHMFTCLNFTTTFHLHTF
jgi:hypothetical protein